MRVALVILGLMCIFLMAHATENKISDEEIQELVNGYKDFNANDGMSAPVRERKFY